MVRRSGRRAMTARTTTKTASSNAVPTATRETAPNVATPDAASSVAIAGGIADPQATLARL